MAVKSAPNDPLTPIRTLASFECGEDAAEHFAFDHNYVNLNHGSYGTTPTEVMDVHHHFRRKAEARPDTFVRYEYRTHLLDEARHLIADYLKVPQDTCVLTQNASIAFDTIMRNIVFQPGDVIVTFPTCYDSFFYTVQYLSETTPVAVSTVQYTLPVSAQQICDAFEDTIARLKAEGKNPKLASFDTVTSSPAVRMPFERLTHICRMNNILSCIDGAHGIGQFPLDLPSLDPDFFMSNCHKWLHVPRPSGVLYVPLRNQHILRATLPTGFNFVPQPHPPKFVANFASVSTLDDTPNVCIGAALIWRSTLTWQGKAGEDAIMAYTQDLAAKGGRITADILGTEVLDSEDHSLTDCSMVNVRLPLDIRKWARGDIGPEEAARSIMRTMIVDKETAVSVYVYGGSIWVRLSAQVYLTLRDFERAALQLKDVCMAFGDGGRESK